MSRFTALGLAVLALVLHPGTSEAQAPGGGPADGGTATTQPGIEFDYYLLSLSWSPQYCASRPGDNSRQCRADFDRGLVVHGLWPQMQTGRTPSCSGTSRVPPQLVEKMLAIMPTARLVQHEWEEHGACSGMSMADYIDTTARAFSRIRIPKALRAPASPISTTVAALEKQFSDANPGLKGNQMAIICDQETRTEVSEIRICLDKELNFRACGSGNSDKCGKKALLLPVP